MRIPMIIVLAAGLTFAAGRAYAIWVQFQLKPGTTDGTDQAFSITTREREGLTEFQVSVEPKSGKEISPFTSGYLMVIEGNHHVAMVPVEPGHSGKKVTFWFRVSRTAVAESRFDIHEQGWAEMRNADGS